MQAQPDHGLVPVPFIVGVGRSGTTLLRIMLDAHPLLAIPSESQFIPPVSRACSRATDPHACFVERLIGHDRWGDFQLSEDLLKESIQAIQPFDLATAFRTVFRLYAERFGKPRWGDKTTIYMMNMPPLQRLFPEAHFIHLIRDGRDVALSIKDLWWGPNSVAEAAGWWMSRIQKARRDASCLSHYLEVRYEDLLLDTETVLRQVCKYLSLPWHPDMLAYYRRAPDRMQEVNRELRPPEGVVVSGEERLAYFQLVSSPPVLSRIGRWRTEMSDADRRAFEATAGDCLKELGYETGQERMNA